LTPTAPCLLAAVLADPAVALTLALPEWGLVVAQARRAGVLARLGHVLAGAGVYGQIPDQPKQHIDSALTHAHRFQLALQQELAYVQAALKTTGTPLVLLKGSAYYAAGNRAGQGRWFSDVDILAPQARLPDLEAALTKACWVTTLQDPYDQRYYRQWMHEIPPMRNLLRQTTLDLHHNILPKTTKSCPDAGLLLANIVQVPGTDYWVLAPEDRVLHSAVHLFYGGEWDNGFRDLSDLDLLLREFSVGPGFWAALSQRAVALQQETVFFYLLRYTAKLLNTPIPEAVSEASQAYAPGTTRLLAMDGLFMKALLPNHPSCNDVWRRFACFMLYLRSHWLRMPMHLLLPHLARKAWASLVSALKRRFGFWFDNLGPT